MKKLIVGLLGLISTISIVACKPQAAHTIKVGTIDGPETKLMEVAAQVAKQRYGLTIDIVTFADYNSPNVALSEGSIDANASQTQALLDDQIKARGYQFTVVGNTFTYPVGLYSKKFKQVADLPDGAKVSIPNDPSNEARGLLLLANAGLITLRPGADVRATPQDIASNPKHLQIVELDAAQLPRSLADVDAAVINTNYAIPAGLSAARDAIFHEGISPYYVNVIVARTKDASDPRIKELVDAFHSEPVKQEAQQLFGDGAVPAF